ncbi:MAG: hypothetical protein ACLRS8_06780 [Parabacteroides merdae]
MKTFQKEPPVKTVLAGSATIAASRYGSQQPAKEEESRETLNR